MPPFDLDYLVVKYSPLGVQLWTNRFGNEGVDETVRGFVLATNGNVYLTGTAGTIKYNSSGLPAWSTSHAGRDITIDSNENCYVTGFIDTDFSVVKLDAGGSNLWTKTWNYANQQDISHVIAVDHAGGVWIAGLATLFCDRLQCHLEFWAVKYGASGEFLFSTLLFEGGYYANSKYDGFECDAAGDLYMAVKLRNNQAPRSWGARKISSTGQIIWGKGLSRALHAEGVARMILDQHANVYYTGTDYAGYQTFKLTRDGTNIWAANYRPGNVGFHRAYGIAADVEGNAYVTGQFEVPGAGNDYATIKYGNNGTNGTVLWVKRFTEAGNSDDQAHAIALGPNGEVYVTGFSNPTNGLYEITTIKYVQTSPIEKKSDGAILLSFCGTPGSNYTIQACATLTNWTNIGSATANPSGLYTFQDTNAPSHPQRFYRALEQ